MKLLNLRKKFLTALILLTPFSVLAHLLEITPTTDFPHTVAATTITTASFTITNISRREQTAVDISKFSNRSGVSVLSSTCGESLDPEATCSIQLSLDARYAGKEISTELKIWAKSSLDVVRYPIQVKVSAGLPNITLLPIKPPIYKPQLPKLREPMIALHDNKWLILSGSLGDFHDFNDDFNTDIYVYNPKSFDLKSVPINGIHGSNLPDDVKKQLASSVPEFVQDGDLLYIVGGFHNPTPGVFTTLNTVTIVDVPGMTQAILKGNRNLKRFVAYCSDNTTPPCPPQFKVTGGQLGQIKDHLFLAYGQDCEGRYCSNSQVYTNAIYKFTAKPNFRNQTLKIHSISSVVHHDLDGSGWRRRDYTLTPFKWNGAEALFAMGGPFTPGSNAQVWTNGIIFNDDLQYDSHFMSQQGNQYVNAHLAMYSAKHKLSYVATFGGLSNLYWSTSGLKYDNTTPYGNILDLISADRAGDVREYVNLKPLCSGKPLEKCLYMGLAAAFIPVEKYYDRRGILQLDELPKHAPTLVGYIYGGLVSTSQEIFPNPPNPDDNFVTNQVYAVYIEPSVFGKLNWQNVTNQYVQN